MSVQPITTNEKGCITNCTISNTTILTNKCCSSDFCNGPTTTASATKTTTTTARNTGNEQKPFTILTAMICNMILVARFF